jgi:hypothetical protein
VPLNCFLIVFEKIFTKQIDLRHGITIENPAENGPFASRWHPGGSSVL